MEAFYLEIRNVHIASAIASGAVFLLRAIGWNLRGAKWAMATPLRYLVYTVDTVLLTAAMMLMVITQQFPGATTWLNVKLLFLLLYVALAWTALGRRDRTIRIFCTIAAIFVFLFAVTIARTHDPMGIFA